METKNNTKTQTPRKRKKKPKSKSIDRPVKNKSVPSPKRKK